MITRRGFIVASGSAVSALTLVGAGPVAAAFARDVTTVASRARAVAPADQGRKHIVLTGKTGEDFKTLEAILRDGPSEELVFSLDAADQLLLDIAQTRTASGYSAVTAEQGLIKLRHISLAGV